MVKERLGYMTEDPNKPFPKGSPPFEGEFKSDVSDHVLVESKGSTLEGYIDLSNMVLGDEVTIREHIKVSEYAPYKLYHEEAYYAPVDPPILYVKSRPSKYGIKITVQQTMGYSKIYPYLFFPKD